MNRAPLKPLTINPQRLIQRFIESAQQGKLDVLTLCVSCSVNLEAVGPDGDTALLAAVRNRQNSALQFLLRLGVNPDLPSPTGATALHVAASMGNCTALDLLLMAGAQLDAKNSSGYTPLMSAASYGEPAAVSLLLSAGARINAIGFDGSSSLHHAALCGHDECVSRLLTAKGINTTLTNSLGQTAEDLAESNGNFKCSDLIKIRRFLDHEISVLSESTALGQTVSKPSL